LWHNSTNECNQKARRKRPPDQKATSTPLRGGAGVPR
jgi:hypothetical protein